MKEEKIYRQEAVVPDRGLPFKLFRFEGADGKNICEAHQHSSVEIFALREGKIFISAIKNMSFRQESL